ncbi:MAG: hypothetical protein EA403_12705 [Spirochaetaceae bacterium]|nr:MAG: hypothetical protein EA403_12705 [Spirochaetaceae bacterium]
MSRTTRTLGAAFVLVVLLPAAAAAQQWYRSNPAGIAAERIAPGEGAGEGAGHPWTLSVQREGGRVERRLWNNGELVETVVQRQGNGGRLLSEERIVDGIVRSRIVYSPGGLIAEEERFSGAGELIERFSYRYQGDRLMEKHASDESGPLWVDVYRYTPDGMLREVRRDYPDQPARASRFRFVAGRLVEEEHHTGERVDRIRYDRLGRAEREEQEEGGAVVLTTRFTFSDDDPNPDVAVVYDARTGETTTRRLDERGRAVTEVRTDRSGREIERVEREFGPHGVAVESREAPGRRELRQYRYRDDGSLAELEERVNNRLQLRVIHLVPDDDDPGTVEDRAVVEGDRVEERFRDGRLVLRLVFRGDRIISQEVIRDGDVLRTR